MWIILLICFFLVSLIYASAGFGGGSLYLAILSGAFFSLSVPIPQFKFIALLCNGTVALLGFIQLARSHKSNVPWKQLFFILLCSSPFAFLAASLKIQNETFLIWLGYGLLLAAISILLPLLVNKIAPLLPTNFIYPFASIFGFLSGITGIGGGVYLAPILHFTSFSKDKSIATVTTSFIAVNSFVALSANLPNFNELDSTLYLLVPAVIAGGFIGNSILRLKMNTSHLKIITAFILVFAAIRLLIR
ncbi:MAG: sulfite exporter TauE/SafE family protein [Bacteroidota bacterium]